jgi:hypothetical protein
LSVVEALVAEPHGDGERALSVVADDDDGLVGVELGVGAGGDFAHGHEECVREAGELELDGFADVEQKGRVGLVAKLEVGLGGDLRIKREYVGHDSRINAVFKEICGVSLRRLGRLGLKGVPFFLQKFAMKLHVFR